MAFQTIEYSICVKNIEHLLFNKFHYVIANIQLKINTYNMI